MHGVRTYFQVGEISKLEREVKIDEMKAREKQKLDMLSQSELDLFMVRLTLHTLPLPYLCALVYTNINECTCMCEWFCGIWWWSSVQKVSQIYNLTHHVGTELCWFWWTLHGWLKHVLPAWKRLLSEMRIVFCSNSMTVTLFLSVSVFVLLFTSCLFTFTLGRKDH